MYAGHYIGEDVGDIMVYWVRSSLAPVRLVHLLFHDRALERAVGERVHGVKVHVVFGEELFQLVAPVALGPAFAPSLADSRSDRPEGLVAATRAFTFGR